MTASERTARYRARRDRWRDALLAILSARTLQEAKALARAALEIKP